MGVRAQDKTKHPRVPVKDPQFSLSTLKKAIPAHCFERSLVRSFGYLVLDLVVVAALFYTTRYADLLPSLLVPFYWIAYWLAQGFFFTGLWVIAHECGHQAFSDYGIVNDCVGLVVHSCLLVPYFSWKISHAKHHSKTANVDLDEAFVPALESDSGKKEDSDKSEGKRRRMPLLKAIATMVSTLTVGWFMYLFLHKTGRKYPRWTSHFNPNAPLFKSKDAPLVIISDVALLVFIGLLAYLSYTYSFLWVVMVYGIPYLHCNFWLVSITLLQHTDQKLPHYFTNEWKWLKGALATVDRDYGILNVIFHHIGDTHVTHHLFSTLPHYHAQEATKAIVPILKDYYCRDDTPILRALWHCFRECDKVYEEDTDGLKVLWFPE